jgi:hypothetical protein
MNGNSLSEQQQSLINRDLSAFVWNQDGRAMRLKVCDTCPRRAPGTKPVDADKPKPFCRYLLGCKRQYGCQRSI